MKILFLKIPTMRFYKGAVREDMPLGPAGEALDPEAVYEKYNFDPVKAPNGAFCLGWFDAGDEGLPVENIGDTDLEAELAEHVLVVWCAGVEKDRTAVVGWYADAVVNRGYEELTFDGGYVQTYNVMDEAANCVLLPETERSYLRWAVPEAEQNGWGMSRKNIWFAREPQAAAYLKKLTEEIASYRGENWLYRYPESPEEE